MTETGNTQVCKCCGKELPLEMFRVSRLGVHKTCKECTKKHQKEGHANKKLAEMAQADLAKARNLRLCDFTPRELMVELKRRGYKFRMEYTETHVIDSERL